VEEEEEEEDKVVSKCLLPTLLSPPWVRVGGVEGRVAPVLVCSFLPSLPPSFTSPSLWRARQSAVISGEAEEGGKGERA